MKTALLYMAAAFLFGLRHDTVHPPKAARVFTPPPNDGEGNQRPVDLFSFGMAKKGQGEKRPFVCGDPAPDFTVKTLDLKYVSLSSFKRPLVLIMGTFS